MKKLTTIVDILLLISFLLVAITGVIFFFFIPNEPGTGLRGAALFWGITKAAWKNWHNYAGIAMVSLTVLHIIANWKVFMAKTKLLFMRKEK
ncbi:MAG: DUF4405 domain-containing protein [Candidatus Woesearchaeota archaeon]